MGQLLPSVCPFDCPDSCGLLVRVEDGRATSVRGDPEHPFTRGFLCSKMNHYHQRVHSDQRLSQPLVRTGPKGSGEFREASWEEAMGLIEENMRQVIKRHGAEAILPYSFAGHMGAVHKNIGQAFFHKLGASRLARTICGTCATAGFTASLGSGPSTDIESTVDSDFIIIWGNNTLSTNVHAWPFFQKARRQGAQIVVVDPYRNRTAKQADWHIMLRPGTDAALAMGVMHVLVQEDMLDHDFIASHTLGYEELKARLNEYPPEKAQEISGVPASDIRRLARDYGRAKAPYIRTGWGFSRQLKGGMAMRTVALLPALVGAFNKKGGGITRSTSPGSPLNRSAVTREDLSPPGVREINMVELGKALNEVNDPPVKLLYVYLSNPAVVAPDSSRVRAGLLRDDLFIVTHDMFMTETARHADVVLPGTSSLEMTDIYTGYGHYYLQMVRPVIPPVGMSRSMLTVFQDLAQRFGFTEKIFSATEDEIISRLLESDSPYLTGMTFERVQSCRPLRVNVPANPYAAGFKTPSGKAEFLAKDLLAQGLDSLPDGAPSVDRQGPESYPLQLITPTRHQFLNSTFNEVAALRKKAGPATIMMHPADAEARGVAPGQLVRVFNDRGQCVLQAQITKDAPAGVSVVEGLYWGIFTPGGNGVNHLTSQRQTDMGGGCAFHCNLVEVEPARTS